MDGESRARIFRADGGDAFGRCYLVEGVIDTILAYLSAAPVETLGPGDLRSNDDAIGVIFLTWEHHFGPALLRRTSG